MSNSILRHTSAVILCLLLLPSVGQAQEEFTFTGTVVDSLGRPASDIEVQILNSGNRLAARTRTDQGGRFQATLASDTYRVILRYFAGGVGGLRQDVVLTDVVVDGPTEISAIVPPVYRVMGHVADETGAPVPDALIRRSASGGARTDATGRFEILMLAGTYSLAIEPVQGAPLTSTRLEIEVTEDMQVDVVLRAAWALTGRLVFESGEPVPVTSFTVENATHRSFLIADQTGTFEIFLPPEPASYQLQASFPSAAGPSSLRWMLDMAASREITVVVDRTRSVSVSVTTPAAAPVSDVSVTYHSRWASGTLRTDRAGKVSIPVVRAEEVVTILAAPRESSGLYGRTIRHALEPGDQLTIELALGNDSPLFEEVTETHLPANVTRGSSMDALPVDVDADGDLDMLVASEFRENLLLLNSGAGQFVNVSADQLPRTRHDSEDIVSEDFDSDGDPDVFIVSEDDQVNEFYRNNGRGVFSLDPDAIPVLGTSNAVASGDLDGDGDADVAIGNGGVGEANFLLINDSGRFRDATATNLRSHMNRTQDVDFGDIDLDGDLDLLEGNEDVNRLRLNDGSGQFLSEWEVPTEGNDWTREADFGDVDGDGDLDVLLAVVARFPSPWDLQNRLLLNLGDRLRDETAARMPPDVDNAFDIDLIDLDDDGDLDAVTGNWASPVSLYRAYLNDGSGHFHDGTATAFPPGVAGNGFDIEAADLNGDGRIDLYLSSRGGTDRLLLGVPVVTAVLGSAGSQPESFGLGLAYPNPFNGHTTLDFRLARQSDVEVEVFDVLGRHVRTLSRQDQPAGTHVIRWDGLDGRGQAVATGSYFVSLRLGDQTFTRRIMHLK